MTIGSVGASIQDEHDSPGDCVSRLWLHQLLRFEEPHEARLTASTVTFNRYSEAVSIPGTRVWNAYQAYGDLV